MRRLPTAVAGLALIASGALLSPAFASDPASSTLDVPSVPGSASAAWTGTIPAGSDPTSECATTGGTTADSHEVQVKAPAGGYGAVSAVFTFTITWTPATAENLNDEVLTVLAPDGSEVGSSDSSAASEGVTARDLASGTYTVLSCGYVNTTPQDYAGKVAVDVTGKGTATSSSSSHTVNDKLASFTPATLVDPLLFGGEPGFTFDNSTTDGSREFVDWPVSSRTNIGVLFRSTDGGLSFVKRYADVTDVAGEAGPACLGRQVPYCPTGGGGDTDVAVNDGNGTVYFSSQESLANEAVGASFDSGTTFPADHADPVTGKAHGDADRQWLGYYSGTDDAFLAFHTPLVGEHVYHSTQAGATGSWGLDPVAQIPGVTQSGAMVIDNTGGAHDHTIYIAYYADGINSAPDGGTAFDPAGTPLSGFAVAVSTDDGQTFTNHEVPGGGSPRNFQKISLDRAGNLYAVWTDSTTQQTLLATSKADTGTNVANPGSQWQGPYVVNGAPVNVTIFPDVRAGDPGRIAVIYYGTAADAATPDDVKPGDGGWYPYVSFATDALCGWVATPCESPTFHQETVTAKVNHDDNICTSGTTCAATGGDRNLLDYWDIDLDRQGHVGFVWGDTTNALGYPFVKVARQMAGPSLYASGPAASTPARSNGQPDATGDALFPIAGAQVASASNHPTLDLTGTTIGVRGDQLEVRIGLAQGAGLGAGVPTGNDGSTPLQQAKYLVRFDLGKDAFYLGANVPAGGDPTFFSGTVSDAEGISSGTNPDNLNGFGNRYAALTPATGSVTGNTLVVDAPLSAFAGSRVGAALYSVGTYAMVGPQDDLVTLNTLPITVDAAPTFDTTLAALPPDLISPPPASTPPSSTPSSTPSLTPFSGPPSAPCCAQAGGRSLAATGASTGLAVTGLALLAVAGFARRRRTG